MKTTIQAIVMLCGAFGNGIVMIAAKANLLEQVDMYFKENDIFHTFKYFVKFIYSEKATKVCKIFPLLLTVCTVVKSKRKISQNFMAFSEYMNFKKIRIIF